MAAIITNGNGGTTDVGIWYCANWQANGGGWWPLATYRPLLPDGRVRHLTGHSVPYIQGHLRPFTGVDSSRQ